MTVGKRKGASRNLFFIFSISKIS